MKNQLIRLILHSSFFVSYKVTPVLKIAISR